MYKRQIQYEDDKSGKLHCISGMARVKEGKLHLNFDCRACITSTEEMLASQLSKTFGDLGWEWSHKDMFYGYYVEPGDKRAELLLSLIHISTASVAWRIPRMASSYSSLTPARPA